MRDGSFRPRIILSYLRNVMIPADSYSTQTKIQITLQGWES